MDKDKLKVLISRLKTLVMEIESEVYSDVEAYMPQDIAHHSLTISDYDEIFNDDDGYPD